MPASDMDDPSNQPDQPAKTRRRDFVNAGARCLGVGAIVSFAGFQEIKRRRLVNDPNCILLHTCSDCVEFSSGCSKDKAVAFRVEKESKRSG